MLIALVFIILAVFVHSVCMAVDKVYEPLDLIPLFTLLGGHIASAILLAIGVFLMFYELARSIIDSL